MKRRITIALSLLLLVLMSAGGCGQKGTVIEQTRHEDSRGFVLCDIVVRPDDLDSAPFKLKDQRRSRCDRCPVGARWPDCNK